MLVCGECIVSHLITLTLLLAEPCKMKTFLMNTTEGQEDLVNWLRKGITRVTVWVMGMINLLTTSPDPPSTLFGNILFL